MERASTGPSGHDMPSLDTLEFLTVKRKHLVASPAPYDGSKKTTASVFGHLNMYADVDPSAALVDLVPTCAERVDIDPFLRNRAWHRMRNGVEDKRSSVDGIGR